MDRDRIYIEHILGEITAIEEFVKDLSFDDFIADNKTKHAVDRSFQIIGEAAKNVTHETRDRFSNIPWQQIAGLRDKITHHYFDVNYETVWDTIKYHLPILKQSLKTFNKTP